MDSVGAIKSNRLLQAMILLAIGALSYQGYRSAGERQFREVIDTPLDRAEDGYADFSKRVPDYPETWLRRVRVSLLSPGHWVRLEWEGPNAQGQDRGPYHSTPGGGTDGCDCNDTSQSRVNGSNCTPKGTHVVMGFNDCLPSSHRCSYVTWINIEREIAIHYHPTRPLHPCSQGCVRVSEEVAQIIHNNAVLGKTEVVISGEWTSLEELGGRDP